MNPGRKAIPVQSQPSPHEPAETSRDPEEAHGILARSQQIIKDGPAILYTCETSGDYACTWVTDNLTSLLGYSPSDFLENARFWREHIHEDDEPRVFGELPRLFELGFQVHEYRFRHKDGTYRWMHDHSRLITGENGRPVEIVGCWSDITERKETQEAWWRKQEDLIAREEYRRAEQKFGALLNLVPDGILAARVDGTIEFVNAQTEKMFGYSRDELLGGVVEKLVPESSRKLHRRMRAAFLKHPSQRIMGNGAALRGRRKDGSEFPVHIALSTIMSGGQPLIVAMILEA
jgi:PAS domain S-box-containing protein